MSDLLIYINELVNSQSVYVYVYMPQLTIYSHQIWVIKETLGPQHYLFVIPQSSICFPPFVQTK
jgi:hypothetical protein